MNISFLPIIIASIAVIFLQLAQAKLLGNYPNYMVTNSGIPTSIGIFLSYCIIAQIIISLWRRCHRNFKGKNSILINMILVLLVIAFPLFNGFLKFHSVHNAMVVDWNSNHIHADAHSLVVRSLTDVSLQSLFLISVTFCLLRLMERILRTKAG